MRLSNGDRSALAVGPVYTAGRGECRYEWDRNVKRKVARL